MKTLNKVAVVIASLPIAGIISIGSAGTVFAACHNTVINEVTICVPDSEGGVGGGGSGTVGSGGTTSPGQPGAIAPGNGSAPVAPAPYQSAPALPAPYQQPAPEPAPAPAYQEPAPQYQAPPKIGVNVVTEPQIPIGDTTVGVVNTEIESPSIATENKPVPDAVQSGAENKSALEVESKITQEKTDSDSKSNAEGETTVSPSATASAVESSSTSVSSPDQLSAQYASARQSSLAQLLLQLGSGLALALTAAMSLINRVAFKNSGE